MEIGSNEKSPPIAIEKKKIKILGAVLKLPAKQHRQFSPFTAKMGQMGWIGSAVYLVAPKRPPDFTFFLIAMDADCSFELISIVHWVPQFIEHNKIFLNSVFRYCRQCLY